MKLGVYCGIAAVGFLAACSSSGGSSDIRTGPSGLAADGSIPSSSFYSSGTTQDHQCIDKLGCGAWKIGNHSKSEFKALSGYRVDPDNPFAGKAPDTKTTYYSYYSLGTLNVDERGSILYGTPGSLEGQIDLVFDPANDSFKGKDGTKFEVDAHVGGTKISGNFKTSKMNGSGKVAGEIDTVSAIGNVYGEDSDTAVVGYFMGIDNQYIKQ